ncbi:MAG: HAD family phosphatase [Anaerolineales bacterium]|nr:MAG: HAD family phosphatase [Anaerolineales bacterium]
MGIRAVFFDFGGVLQRTEFQAPRQHLAERFGMDYDDMDKLVFGGGPNGTAAKATTGEISVDQHWKSVARKLKIRDDEIAALEAEFFGGDVIDWSMVGFLRSLRPRHKTGLISNAWSDMREYLLKKKLDDAFDHLVISAEVGIAKPDGRIYHLALQQAQVKAHEAVFVDDVKVNIEACQEIGMQGILFKEPQEAMGQLKQLLKIK